MKKRQYTKWLLIAPPRGSTLRITTSSHQPLQLISPQLLTDLPTPPRPAAPSVMPPLLPVPPTPPPPASPTAALEELLQKVHISHGQSGVTHVLKLIHSAIHPPQTPQEEYNLALQALQEVKDMGSILKEQGRSQIIEDAYTDGSTVYCKGCGGMIKRERWVQHCEFWCDGKEDGGDGMDEG